MNSFSQVVDFLEKNTLNLAAERAFEIQAKSGNTLFLRLESGTYIGDLTVWDEYGTFQQIIASLETGEVVLEQDGVDWRNSSLETTFKDFLSHFD